MRNKKMYENPEVEMMRLRMVLTESTEQGGTQGGSNLEETGFGDNWLG